MKSSRALFLLLLATLAFAVAAPGQQQPASTRTWQQAEKTDPNRAINEIQFTLAGRFLDPPHGNVSGPPTLMLACEPSDRKRNEGRFISGQLQVGAPLKIVFVEPDEIHGTSYFPEVNVTYRVDSEKPQDVQWPPRSDKTSISIDKEGAKKILRGHAVVVTVHESFDSQVVMQFDFPESSEVLQTCGIREHK